MTSRFNPTALKLMEDALAEVFYSHRDFDSFLRRCGVDGSLVTNARNSAETRKGTYQRAPKRFVAQEVLQLLEARGDVGIRILTALFDGLVHGTFATIAVPPVPIFESTIKNGAPDTRCAVFR